MRTKKRMKMCRKERKKLCGLWPAVGASAEGFVCGGSFTLIGRLVDVVAIVVVVVVVDDSVVDVAVVDGRLGALPHGSQWDLRVVHFCLEGTSCHHVGSSFAAPLSA